MKKFSFSLEKVLEVKEIEEKMIHKNLLLLQHEIFEVEKKITLLAEIISEARAKVCSLSMKLVNSVEIMIHYRYIESLTHETKNHQNTLTALRLKEQKIQLQLIEKSKEKKTLERLKEIKFEEHRKDYNKEQQLFLDDISVQNHRMKQGMYK
jgi:flagellar FliJ protein